MNDNALQNRATEIIQPLVPPDAEERVNRSFKDGTRSSGTTSAPKLA
jgi:hypothetical protein